MKRIFLAALLSLLASVAAAEQFSVLLFTKTGGWHHESINAGVAAVQKLGKLHDFNVFWTENADLVFNDEQLKKFKVVIFLLTTGEVLNPDQQAVFERFIRAGGGYVGVHSASDTEYEWDWYTRMVGHMFDHHPPVQTAVLEVLQRDFPGMERFEQRSLFTEEWYAFDAARSQNLNYLLAVDESTYDIGSKKDADGRANFHPVSWYQNYDGGRAFYTALGHLPATYSDADFLHHLYGGIYWAATGKGFRAAK